MTLLFTACNSRDTDTKETTDAKGTTDTADNQGNQEKEVVRVVVPGISEETTVDPISGIKSLGIPDFEAFLEEKMPQYDIQLTSIPWDGWIQKIEVLATSGEADVGFYTNQEAVPNWYMDLTEYLNKDEKVNFDTMSDIWMEPAAYYTSYKSFNYPDDTGKVYGLPMTIASNGIIYDTKLFQDWGVKEPDASMSLHELVGLAEQMTGNNPVTGEVNYGAYIIPYWAEWYAISYDAVKPLKSDTMEIGEFDLAEYADYIKDSEEVRNYFTDMVRLADSAPNGIATSSGAENFLMENNNIALNFDTSNFVKKYMAYVYAEDKEVTDRYKMLPIPEGKDGRQGFPEFFRFSVVKGAKNPDAAWEVIKELTTNKDIVDFYLRNYASDKLPCLKDTAGMKLMDYEINKERYDYQSKTTFLTDDYWHWRKPLQPVNNDLITKACTVEEAIANFQAGVTTWATDLQTQLKK